MKKRIKNTCPSVLYAGLFTMVFIAILASAQPTEARFFQQHSTWYEKIPPNPQLIANSENYVNFVVGVSSALGISHKEWSVPIWYANASTPLFDFTVMTNSNVSRPAILNAGWNLDVPIPPEAKPAGYGATSYRDGHMVVISHDKRVAWDIYQANVDASPPTAKMIKQWDLSSDGIDQPTTHGNCRVSPVPLLQGLITYEEIQNGHIDHAIAFATHSAKTGSPGVYPLVSTNNGQSNDPWAPWLGFRFQLDPTIDVNTLNLNRAGKIIAKALQEYGMIFVENNGPGNNGIYAESLDHKAESWQGIFGSLGAIPLNRFRVVEPIYPSSDLPSSPSGLQVSQ